MNRMVRRAVSRMKSCAVGSKVTSVTRSSKNAQNRESQRHRKMAAMKWRRS